MEAWPVYNNLTTVRHISTKYSEPKLDKTFQSNGRGTTDDESVHTLYILCTYFVVYVTPHSVSYIYFQYVSIPF